jgi:hypothetical protein
MEPEALIPASKRARVAEKVSKPKQEDRLTVKERRQLAEAFPSEESDFLNFMVTSRYDGNVDQMLHDRLRLQPRDFNIQDHQCYVSNRLHGLRKHFGAMLTPLIESMPVLTAPENPLPGRCLLRNSCAAGTHATFLLGLDRQCPPYWAPQTSSCTLVSLSPTTVEYQRVFTKYARVGFGR